jgi:hypothetical protein
VVAQFWRASAPLTAAGLLMIPVLTLSLAGLVVDPTTVTGAPAWLKPAKFAASITIYTLTLAWVFGYLPAWRRTRAVVGWTTAVVLLVEIAIIVGQAWRGVASHFNVGTDLDAVLFSTMGVAIAVQTLASIAVAVALWRQTFDDRALGWAFRLGMTLTIVGASMGGLMTVPSADQLARARVARPVVMGAHTVGAGDGGPGLPGTGWSLDHGDIRVPHFIGLHALQVLPLFVVFMRRGRRYDPSPAAVVAVGTSYAALFAILLTQALMGQSVTSPRGGILWAIVVGALACALALWGTSRRAQQSATPAVVA